MSALKPIFDQNLKDYATEKQWEKYMAWIAEGGSTRKAANRLGLADAKSITQGLEGISKKALEAGYVSPYVLSEGLELKGTSTLYGDDGKAKLTWVKTNKKAEDLKKVFEAMFAALSGELPVLEPRPFNQAVSDQLLNQYTITDYHLGMLAWDKETGANWDLRIAEETLISYFAAAIEESPKAHTAVFAQLGDFLHFDGLLPVTPTSKHVLDADTRFEKLVESAIRVIMACISMLLSKHQHVHVIMAEGNHDLASSVWLRQALNIIYQNEDRITVDTRPDPYYHFQWGSTCLFYHHSHLKKMEQLPSVFVAKFKEDFGRSKNVYAHTGHFHHVKQIESNLMIVEQHRTLAAPDAHASRGGWISGRDAKVTTYHKDFGKVGEKVVSFDMLKHAEAVNEH
ncbi:MAG: winged helix-turn-helix domain-containing protein [Pseudomonadota bacterium]|nr:winged helix-turn-helix domain-containing protein [Pseudomonadota bacterium]